MLPPSSLPSVRAYNLQNYWLWKGHQCHFFTQCRNETAGMKNTFSFLTLFLKHVWSICSFWGLSSEHQLQPSFSTCITSEMNMQNLRFNLAFLRTKDHMNTFHITANGCQQKSLCTQLIGHTTNQRNGTCEEGGVELPKARPPHDTWLQLAKRVFVP